MEVQSPNTKYSEDYIESKYEYQSTNVTVKSGKLVATPVKTDYTFRTERQVRRFYFMLH